MADETASIPLLLLPREKRLGLPRLLIILNTLQTVSDDISACTLTLFSDYLTSSVGIGSDYDGIESTPKGLEDVSKYPNLVSFHLRLEIESDK